MRFSWDRFDEPHDKLYGDVDPNLPFTGPYQLTGPPFPQINLDGYEGMFPRTFRQPKNDAYSASTTLSKTMGRHFAKLGGEFRAYQFFRQDEVNSNGVFGFGNLFTRRDPLNNTGAASGNGLATFLLGLPTNGSVVTGTPRTEQYRYYALFVQDDWKLSSRATLNVGLRWDYQPPVTVKDNLTVSGFDANVTNPIQARLPQGAATINPATGQPLVTKGGLLFANQRRSRVAVQGRLEQHPAARRLHLQGQRLAAGAHQLRPVLPGTLERRAERRLHRPTSSGRRRSSRRRPTASIRGRRGPTRSPPASCSRSPASWDC